MSKHTPGPWVVSRDDLSSTGALVGIYVAKQDNGMIAETFWNCLVNNDGQCRANARLIAAAPELLEALALAHDHLAVYHESLDGTPSDVLTLIRAVLDKATGFTA